LPRRLLLTLGKLSPRSGERVAELRKLRRDLAAEEGHGGDCNDCDESDEDSVFGEGGTLFIVQKPACFID